jgi:hypothetical protein
MLKRTWLSVNLPQSEAFRRARQRANTAGKLIEDIPEI